MIGLDTNILVRFLTNDDPTQSPRSRQIIGLQLTEQDPGYVTLAAIVETAWVLENIYKLSSFELAKAVRLLLQIETLAIQNEQEVYTAMIALEERKADFVGALIAALGQYAGCTTTLTFDRKAARLQGFALAK
jgi:predicted nucleic-acid-binding protein